MNVSGQIQLGSFAYQAILGAAFPIAAIPGLAITAEYRFLGTAGNRDYGGVASRGGARVTARSEGAARADPITTRSWLVCATTSA